MATQDMFRARDFYNNRDQEVRDDLPYAAIAKAVTEVVQSGNFLGPVESNNGFTENGVAISGGGSKHVIEDSGTPVTVRDNINFTGTGVALSDDGTDTVVTITDTDTDTVYSHPNHTGDVTSSGDGATTIVTDAVATAMVQDEAITNTKLAHMAQSTFKGRDKDAGTGDATDLSRTQAAETLRGPGSASSNATSYAINADTYATFDITNQTATITGITFTGTPSRDQTLWISITGTTAVAFTLDGTDFEASTLALPTTTVSTDRLDIGFVYNSATSKFRLVAQA